MNKTEVANRVRELDRWAAAKAGRSWETCRRRDSSLWSAVAWENGTEVAVSIERYPDTARRALALDLSKAGTL